MFDYGGFQAKVDIKNLASDIALKIFEAQNFFKLPIFLHCPVVNLFYERKNGDEC